MFSADGTRGELHGEFDVPEEYNTNANLVIVWTASVTSGDIEWDFDYRAVGGDDTESLDQTGYQESVNSEDTAPSAAFERMELTIALTNGNFSPGDTVQFLLARDDTDAGDTMAGMGFLFDAFFEFDD